MTKGSKFKLNRYTAITGLFLAVALLMMFITFFPYGTVTDISENTGDYNITVLMPLSGPLSEYGTAYARGALMAAEEINANGGVRGHNININYFDYESDRDLLKNGFFDAYDRSVQAAIGPLTSTDAHEIAPYSEMYGVVLLSPSATAPELDEYKDYFYRIVPSDSYLGSCAASVFGNMKSVSNISLIYSNDNYGNGLANAFENELNHSYPDKKLVMKISIEDRLDADGTHIASELKNTSTDGVFIAINYINDLLLILDASKNAGISPVWLGTDYAQTEELSFAGDYADKFMVCIPSVEVTDNGFENRYIERFRTVAGISNAIYGYDAMRILAQAIYSGGYNADEIKETLDDMRYVGLTGSIKFNSNNDRYPSYDIMEYSSDNGHWKRLGWSALIDFAHA